MSENICELLLKHRQEDEGKNTHRNTCEALAKKNLPTDVSKHVLRTT